MHEILLRHMTDIPFRFRDFAKVFGSSLLLMMLFILILSFFPGASEFMATLHPSVSFIIIYVIQLAVLFFPLWFFVIDKYELTLKDFALTKISGKRLVKEVLFLYFAYLICAIAFGVLVQVLGQDVPGYGQQESYVPFFGDDTFGLIVGFFFVAIMAPLTEELYFRGFIYRTFTKTWPVWLGSLLTASLFALVHLQLSAFIPLLIVGLFLNWAYERSKNLWVPIVLHSLNNLVAFGLDLYLHHHPEVLDQLTSLAPSFLMG